MSEKSRERRERRRERRARREQSPAPVVIALVLIAAVWVGACVISFMEQIRLAEEFEFEAAWLFPLIFDGLASALAVTSWSAALDGRHSPLLRLVTMAAVSGSAWVNAAAVMERTTGVDVTQVGMAVAAPISAWVAFEFLLGELRRQIMRARGVPAPAPVPALRPVRVLLSPVRSVREWRTLALTVTDPRREITQSERSAESGPDAVPMLVMLSALLSARTDAADTGADSAPDIEADTVSAPDGRPAGRPHLTVAAPPAPAPVSAPAPGRVRPVSAPASDPVPAPRVSGADSTPPQVTGTQRPPVSAPAPVPVASAPVLQDAPSDVAADASDHDADTGADTRSDRPTVSAAVEALMRQGITDTGEIVRRVPVIVGRDVSRDTVSRTVRRHRERLDADAHAGNYL